MLAALPLPGHKAVFASGMRVHLRGLETAAPSLSFVTPLLPYIHFERHLVLQAGTCAFLAY